MNKSSDTLAEIEETQAALRESIAHTKKLSDQTDRLLKRHRKELREGNSKENSRRSGSRFWDR